MAQNSEGIWRLARGTILNMGKLKETTAWREALIALADQVEDWVLSAGPETNITVVDGSRKDPTAEVPLLELRVGLRSKVRLEPRARDAENFPTRVYVYDYPSLRRAVLYGPMGQGTWQIQTTEGVLMNYAWSQEGFLSLIHALVSVPLSRRA